MAAGAVIPAPVGGYQQRLQRYNKSCGAASLLCAALELGYTMYPAIGTQAMMMLQNNNASEKALYYITSEAQAKGHPFANLASEGYSMPSRVIEAAFHIGFQGATIYMQSTLSKAILKAAYAAEVQRCVNLANVNIVEGKAARTSQRPALLANECKLVIVEPFMAGLHYVLHRSQGSYMDPGTGNNYTSMPAYYNRTGISVVLW